MVVPRHRRGVVAAAALVAFNLVMFVLAAVGSNPIEAPLLVAWNHGRCRLDPGGAGPHRTLVAGNQPEPSRYIPARSRTQAGMSLEPSRPL